jgi:hypothetical protein
MNKDERIKLLEDALVEERSIRFMNEGCIRLGKYASIPEDNKTIARKQLKEEGLI